MWLFLLSLTSLNRGLSTPPTCITDPRSITRAADPTTLQNVFYLQEQNARVAEERFLP